MLGVDIYKLTAMHYTEDIMPKEISDIFAPTEDGTMVEVSFEMGEKRVNSFDTTVVYASEY